MKNILLVSLLIFCGTLLAQNHGSTEPGGKVILVNEKMTVVEFVSLPQGDVCGAGMHKHQPHLTIILTDSKIRVTPKNGEPQDIEVKSGSAIWFDVAETHSAINIGEKPTKMILVYLKE